MRSVAPEPSYDHNETVIDPAHDAFGAALLDYLEGKHVPELVLEVEGGQAGPAMPRNGSSAVSSDGTGGIANCCRSLSMARFWIWGLGLVGRRFTCDNEDCLLQPWRPRRARLRSAVAGGSPMSGSVM
jgi:hypothetical protein